MKFVVIILLATLVTAAGCAVERDVSRQERIDNLEQELMCACDAGHLHPMSHPSCLQYMRNELAAMIDEGRDDDKIMAAFVEKYGSAILAAPPVKGWHLFTWIMPFVAIMSGILAVVTILRQWRGTTGSKPTAGHMPEVPNYKDRIEAELRDFQSPG